MSCREEAMVVGQFSVAGSTSPDAQNLGHDFLYFGGGRTTGVTQNVVWWNAKIFENYLFLK
jgi:hypothetical protein